MHRRSFLTCLTALLGLAAGRAGTPAQAGSSPDTLDLTRLYRRSEFVGLDFTDEVLRHAGRRVAVQGYIAPHLRTGARFLVLANELLPACPHCLGNVSLPPGAIVLYPRDVTGADFEPPQQLLAEGVLELGAKSDPGTGYVSTIRLLDARLLVA